MHKPGAFPDKRLGTMGFAGSTAERRATRIKSVVGASDTWIRERFNLVVWEGFSDDLGAEQRIQKIEKLFVS
jgi:hypothetical protein